MTTTKFYVTIIRNPGPDQRVRRLLGPYDTLEEAEGHVDDARRLAVQCDPMAHFDSFGVSSWARDELAGMLGILGQELEPNEFPRGLLNHLLEAEQAMAE